MRSRSLVDRSVALAPLFLAIVACGPTGEVTLHQLEPERVEIFTSTSQVRVVTPMSDGFLAGTTGGLLEFDTSGHLRRLYTRRAGLGSSDVTSLLVTEKDEWWVGTTSGVSRIRSGIVTTYTASDGLNDDRVHSLALANDGTVLAGTGRGVSRFDGRRWSPVNDTHEFSRRPTYDIHTAEDGSIWFAKENALTRSLPDGSWQVFQRDPLLPGPRSDLVSNSMTRVMTDADGAPWAGTARGLGWFDGRRWRRHLYAGRFDDERGLRSDRIAALARGADGAIWVAHGDDRLDEVPLGAAVLRDRSWNYLTEADGLPSDRVYGVRVDDFGNIWLATSRGVALYDGETVVSYGHEGALPHNRVLDIIPLPEDRIAVLTADGLVLFGRTDLSGTIVSHSPNAIAFCDDALFVALDHGLVTLGEETQSAIPYFGERRVISIACTETADLLVVDEIGIHRGRPGAWRMLLDDALDLHHPQIIPGPGDSFWITGVDDGRAIGMAIGESLGVHDPPPGVHAVTTHVSHDPDGRAWFAADGGLVDVDGRPLAPPDRRGLSVRVSHWDRRGHLWIGTRDHGLFRFDGRQWLQFDLHGAPLAREITALHVRESDDTLWVGTASEGLFRIDLSGLVR